MQQPALAKRDLSQPAVANGDRPWPEIHPLQGTMALSLKARETASLSLKRIYEQHVQVISSSAPAAAPHSPTDHHPQTSSSHDQYPKQLQVDLDLRMATPSTGASLSTHTEIIQRQVVQVQSLRPLPCNADADIDASTSKVAGQLTLFYAGTVCVFEDVPADKQAKAIMLLAAGSAGEQSYMSRAHGSHGIVGAHKSRPTTPEIVSSRPPIKPRARSQAELPFARKASLARFLEKRKDRVEGKANETELQSTKDGDISKEPPQKKICRTPSTKF